MEEDSTEREYDTEELLDAGASTLFCTYYRHADADASAVREVDSGPFSLESLGDNPRLGGGFFAALWEGDRDDALRRADRKNSRILEEMPDHEMSVATNDL